MLRLNLIIHGFYLQKHEFHLQFKHIYMRFADNNIVNRGINSAIYGFELIFTDHYMLLI